MQTDTPCVTLKGRVGEMVQMPYSTTDQRDYYDLLDEHGYWPNDMTGRFGHSDESFDNEFAQHTVRAIVSDDGLKIVVLSPAGVSEFEVTLNNGTPNSVIEAVLTEAESFAALVVSR